MASTVNLKNTAPGISSPLPAFSKGSDGTADFGSRYNPITGACAARLQAHAAYQQHNVPSLQPPIFSGRSAAAGVSTIECVSTTAHTPDLGFFVCRPHASGNRFPRPEPPQRCVACALHRERGANNVVRAQEQHAARGRDHRKSQRLDAPAVRTLLRASNGWPPAAACPPVATDAVAVL